MTDAMPQDDLIDEFGMSEPGPDDDLAAIAQSLYQDGALKSDIKPTADPLPVATQPTPTDATTAIEDGKPVLAADGKSVIPHAVLRDTRERAKQLEQERDQLAQQLAALQAGAAKPPATAQQPQSSPTMDPDINIEDLSEDELKAIEMDFPEQARIIRAQHATIRKLAENQKALMEKAQRLEQNVSPILSRDQQEQQERIRREDEEINDVIDRVPEMRWLASRSKEMPDVWGEVLELEKTLRALPRYRNGPLASEPLFREIIAEIQAARPELTIPTEYQSPAHLKQAAAAIVAGAKPFTPQRMSDFSGGIPPEAGQMRLSEMSEDELLGLYLKHGPDEFNRLTAGAS